MKIKLDTPKRSVTVVMDFRKRAFRGVGAEAGGFILARRNSTRAIMDLGLSFTPIGSPGMVALTLENALRAAMYEEGDLTRGRVDVAGSRLRYELKPEVGADRGWLRDLKALRKTGASRQGRSEKTPSGKRRSVDYYLRQAVGKPPPSGRR